MVGHYLRVQDAARLLDVSPATIRWYSLQGWLPAYRVGHGPGGHRRFLYADLQALARRTGRFIPDEPEWDQGQSLTVDHVAQYLGLSVRYLLDNGWVSSGTEWNWEGLRTLERQIYSEPERPIAVEKEGESSMMMESERGCGCHGEGMHRQHEEGGWRSGPMHGGPGRQGHHGMAGRLAGEEASLMMLRRARRHLEVQKADLEDQIEDLERRIASHPDTQPPS